MAKTFAPISFKAKLHRPSGSDKGASWTFLKLPSEASEKLPSRSMVSVEGTFHGIPFQATLEPDGNGGHWLKVDNDLREAAGAEAGNVVELEISPVTKEPEPVVPQGMREAIEAAGEKAMATWASITPVARRDWIYWITTAKKEETRVKRIEVACSKLAAGNRRPCCFDRSGMYDKSLSCPIPEMGDEERST
jgi:hypothetical protein